MLFCPVYLQSQTDGFRVGTWCVWECKSGCPVRFLNLNSNFESQNLHIKTEVRTFVNSKNGQIRGCTPLKGIAI